MIPKKTLKIAQVNGIESAGGAARIAHMLYQQLGRHGQTSWMVVGAQESDDPGVIRIPAQSDFLFAPLFQYLYKKIGSRDIFLGKKRLGEYLYKLIEPRHWLYMEIGLEDFEFPASRRILDLLPSRPDILHVHNLHRNYFDLCYLPSLSAQIPIVLTMHDAWLLSGHCAHSLDCIRWKSGCGNCPYLGVYPPVQRDLTNWNWRRKKVIFSKSKLYLATPSRWLMDKVEQSILQPAIVEGRVIHNGVDTTVFHPNTQQEARALLGIPQDVITLLFTAQRGSSGEYKDFQTIAEAINILKSSNLCTKILLLVLGEMTALADDVISEYIQMRYIPYQSDLGMVANYYRAADIYLHAARADTFPNVILEALACGKPVIATRVGGIAEQIIDGGTGFLVEPADPAGMAKMIIRLIQDKDLIQTMSKQATEDAAARFSMERMVQNYLQWYDEILNRSE